MKKEDVCPECRGEGQIGVRSQATCPKCNGTGHIVKQELTEDEIKDIIRFHIEAIGATYGKDSLEPILDAIAQNILTALKGKEEGK